MNDVEKPRHEPEILPPERPEQGPTSWNRHQTFGTAQMRVFRVGPVGMGLIGLAVAAIVLAILILLTGFLLVAIPAVVISIVVAGLIARLRRPR